MFKKTFAAAGILASSSPNPLIPAAALAFFQKSILAALAPGGHRKMEKTSRAAGGALLFIKSEQGCSGSSIFAPRPAQGGPFWDPPWARDLLILGSIFGIVFKTPRKRRHVKSWWPSWPTYVALGGAWGGQTAPRLQPEAFFQDRF